MILLGEGCYPLAADQAQEAHVEVFLIAADGEVVEIHATTRKRRESCARSNGG